MFTMCSLLSTACRSRAVWGLASGRRLEYSDPGEAAVQLRDLWPWAWRGGWEAEALEAEDSKFITSRVQLQPCCCRLGVRGGR